MSEQYSDHLELRLARSRADIRAAQALRFRVFYKEMGASVGKRAQWFRRDIDSYDRFCDHLIVIDRARSRFMPRVVGTYRLLRGSVALRHGGFYTAGEFDLTPLMPRAHEILELGRSCVDPAYRGGPTMQLLWRGISEYLVNHEIGLMLGCASFSGTDPDRIGHALSFLHDRHLVPSELRPQALPERFVAMNRVSPDAIDPARARRELPPLVKGYLRLGGNVGDGAVIDHSFNTIDVCIVLPVEAVKKRYVKHYYRSQEQVAA